MTQEIRLREFCNLLKPPRILIATGNLSNLSKVIILIEERAQCYCCCKGFSDDHAQHAVTHIIAHAMLIRVYTLIGMSICVV